MPIVRKFCILLLLAIIVQVAALILLSAVDAFTGGNLFGRVSEIYFPMSVVVDKLNLCDSGGWDMIGCGILWIFVLGLGFYSFVIALMATFLMSLAGRSRGA